MLMKKLLNAILWILEAMLVSAAFFAAATCAALFVP